MSDTENSRLQDIYVLYFRLPCSYDFYIYILQFSSLKWLTLAPVVLTVGLLKSPSDLKHRRRRVYFYNCQNKSNVLKTVRCSMDGLHYKKIRQTHVTEYGLDTCNLLPDVQNSRCLSV